MKEEEKKMYCGNCGIQNDDRAMFCQSCGAKLNGGGNQNQQQYVGFGPGGQSTGYQSMVYESKGIGKTAMVVKIVSMVLCAITALFFFHAADEAKYSIRAWSYALQTGISLSSIYSTIGTLFIIGAIVDLIGLVLYCISWAKIDRSSITASCMGLTRSYQISDITSVRAFGCFFVFIHGNSGTRRIIVDDPKRVQGILESMIYRV